MNATWKVRLAYEQNWRTLGADLDFTDETARVASVSGITTDRGRGNERDEFRTGRASLTFKNPDRYFDPDYEDGPRFGQLKPGVPIDIVSVLNGVEEPIFGGFVRSWPQAYARGNTFSTVKVELYDGTDHLANGRLPDSYYDWLLFQIASGPKAYWKLNESSGLTAFDSSGNGYHGVYRNSPVVTSPADGLVLGEPAQVFDGVSQAVDIPNPDVRLPIGVPADGLASSVVLWFRSTSTPAATEYDTLYNQSGPSAFEDVIRITIDDSGKLQGTWVDSGGGGFSLSTDSSEWLDNNVHMLVGVCRGDIPSGLFEGGFQVDGEIPPQSFDTQGSNNTYAVVIGGHPSASNPRDYFNGQMSHVAIFEGIDIDPVTEGPDLYAAGVAPLEGQTSDERLAFDLDTAGWPADLRDLNVGDTILPAAVELGLSHLAYARRIEMTEQGMFFIARNRMARFLNRYFYVTDAESMTSQVTLTDRDYIDVDIDSQSASLVENDLIGSREGSDTTVVRSDEDSIDDYGHQGNPMHGLLAASDVQVATILEYRLVRYKNPQRQMRRIEILLDGRPDWLVAKLFALEIGHRTTAQRTPQQVGDPIEVVGVVQSIGHRITRSGWKMVLDISPVDLTEFAKWGSGLWGTAIWGY